MKKIKILNYLVIVMLLVNIIWLAQQFNLSIKVMNDEALQKTFERILFKHYKFFVDLFFTFLFVIGIIFVQKGLYNILKKGFFNKKSNSLFRKGGLLFIISGLCSFIINIVVPLFKGQNFFKMFIGNDFYILVIGLSLYLTADLIKDGSSLKHENELTI